MHCCSCHQNNRITPVHVPGKQIGKVIAGRGKIWAFGLKFSAFDSSSGFKPLLKISAQDTVPIKKKINIKILSAGQITGVSFCYTLSWVGLQCPTSLLKPPVPGCHCTRALSLGGDPDPSELSPFPECCAANQAAGPPGMICSLLCCFWGFLLVHLYFLLFEANLPVIHLASLKPKPEDLAELCPKRDHSAAHNCSSRGSLNTWLKWKLMKVALNTKFLLAASPSACGVTSWCRTGSFLWFLLPLYFNCDQNDCRWMWHSK